MEKNEAQKSQEQAQGTQVKSPVDNGSQPKPEENMAAVGDGKTAPTDKTVEGQAASDAPSGEDITSAIMLLNEFDKLSGGKGEISEIPENLHGVIKFTIGKMLALRDAFYDPLYKAITDDMVDQREDGMEPSVLVAIARTVPVEEIQKLADSEEYSTEQQRLMDEKSAKEQEAVSDEELYSKFEQSQKNIEAYCERMGYDDAEKEDFYGVINMWRDVFADGLISDPDCERIDNERNYKKDIASLTAQIPSEPTKEVIPDKSSVGPQGSQQKQAQTRPQNSIETMASVNAGMTDFTQTGKRKIYGKKQ